MSSDSQPTFYDFCCGCGGMTKGFELAGWRCLGGVDILEHACETFDRNIAAPSHCISVGEFDPLESPTAVIAGTPCQPHSLSGHRLGMRDPRAQAFHDVMDQIEAIKPEMIIFENVPGLASSKDADGVPGGALRHVRSRMLEAGYTPWHQVMDAHAYGVAQVRPRIFIVGVRSGMMWVAPQQMRSKYRRTVYDAFCDILCEDDVDLPNHEFTRHKPETIERIRELWGLGKWGLGKWSLYDNFTQSWARLALDLPAPTQTENHGGLCIHPLEPRVITPREMARLQSFPDDFEFSGRKAEIVVQIGNAVPVLLAKAVAKSVLPLISR